MAARVTGARRVSDRGPPPLTLPPARIRSWSAGGDRVAESGAAAWRCGRCSLTRVRRLAAWLVDWLLICAYAAALVPFGLLISDAVADLPVAALNAGAFVITVLPATVWLAAWEGGDRGATPGKRVFRLQTLGPDGGPPGWQRALLRNALKLALPWELGHAAAFALVWDNDSILGMVCGYAACLIALVYVVMLLATGRTPYDRLSGTSVRRL